MPPRCASYLTAVDDPSLPVMERHIKVLIYTCEVCRYVAMFAPPSPLEEFEKRQAEEQAITDPVGRFMYNFREYSDEKLQQVIDGKGYVPEAKKAAKQLLYRRRYPGNKDKNLRLSRRFFLRAALAATTYSGAAARRLPLCRHRTPRRCRWPAPRHRHRAVSAGEVLRYADRLHLPVCCVRSWHAGRADASL